MEFDNKIEKDNYLDALKALECILKQWGEWGEHWLAAIQRDIKLWISERQSEQHLGHYGGMGSFNDLGGGPYFDNIKSIAYRLAKNPDDINSVEKSLGRLGLQLDGWTCMECGYNEVYESKIKQYVNQNFVRTEVLENFKNGRLLELAKKRHNYDFSDLDEEYKKVTNKAESSKISVVERHEWSESCPKCGEKGIQIRHWILSESGDEFIPYILDGSALPDNIRSAFK